jgi:large subunit ribosomal protein LX
MKNFKVTGNYFYRQDTYPFTKTVTSENEDAAREKVYMLMGSNHKLKRGEMEITEVESIKSESKPVTKSKEEKPPEKVEEKTEEPVPEEPKEEAPVETPKAE